MEGEGFAKEFTAQLHFLLISIQYRSRSRFGRGFIGSPLKNQVGHLFFNVFKFAMMRTLQRATLGKHTQSRKLACAHNTTLRTSEKTQSVCDSSCGNYLSAPGPGLGATQCT